MTSKSEFRKRVLEEGVPAAFDGLMRVLQDPKAWATALASAARTMIEAGGLLKAPEDGTEKEPHEMTAAELQRKIVSLRREAIERAQPVIDLEPRQLARHEGPDGVFD